MSIAINHHVFERNLRSNCSFEQAHNNYSVYKYVNQDISEDRKSAYIGRTLHIKVRIRPIQDDSSKRAYVHAVE